MPCGRCRVMEGRAQGAGTRAVRCSSCRVGAVTILIASIVLTRGVCAGGQDVVSARVYMCAIKRKLLLACGQARVKAEFTQSQKRDLSHEGEMAPAPSAASGTKKPRRNGLCGMCRSCCGVPSSGFWHLGSKARVQKLL